MNKIKLGNINDIASITPNISITSDGSTLLVNSNINTNIIDRNFNEMERIVESLKTRISDLEYINNNLSVRISNLEAKFNKIEKDLYIS